MEASDQHGYRIIGAGFVVVVGLATWRAYWQARRSGQDAEQAEKEWAFVEKLPAEVQKAYFEAKQQAQERIDRDARRDRNELRKGLSLAVINSLWLVYAHTKQLNPATRVLGAVVGTGLNEVAWRAWALREYEAAMRDEETAAA